MAKKVEVASAISAGLESAREKGVNQTIDKTEKKSQEHVQRKAEAARHMKGDKEQLFEYWKRNNPDGKRQILEEDPKYLALRELKDSYIKKEAFILLGLIEKHWGREEANRAYKSCWKGENFHLKPLWEYFSKERAADKLGFYYGERTILHKIKLKSAPSLDYTPWSGSKKNIAFIGSNYGYGIIKGKGWWVVDNASKPELTAEDEKSMKNWEETYNYKLPKIDGVMEGRDVPKAVAGMRGDKYVSKGYMQKGISSITKELRASGGKAGSADSGLTPEMAGNISKDLEALEKDSKTTSESSVNTSLMKWFNDKAQNRWIALTEDIIGPMSLIYGERCGRYLYRYVPSQKRIYAIGIDGAKLNPKYGNGSYIEIKDGKLGTWLGGKNGEDAELMLRKQLLDQMTPAELKTEIDQNKALQDKNAPKETLLTPSKGRISLLLQKHKLSPVNYSALKSTYLDKLEVLLKKDLIDNFKYTDEQAGRFALVRIEQLKKDIEAKLDDQKDVLRKAVDDKPDTALNISIDSDDKVTVSLRDEKLSGKLRKAAKKGLESVKDAAGIAEDKIKEVSKKLAKFGPFGALIEKFLNLPEKIKEFYTTGKSSWLLTGIGGFLGVKFGRELIGSKTISNPEDLKKLAKENGGVLKDNRVIDEDLKLEGLKIVIPKGNGIKPGKKFELKAAGAGKVTADPSVKKEKPEKGKFSLFGGGKPAEEFLFKNYELEIEKNATIPKGSVIPKGSKILTA